MKIISLLVQLSQQLTEICYQAVSILQHVICSHLEMVCLQLLITTWADFLKQYMLKSFYYSHRWLCIIC